MWLLSVTAPPPPKPHCPHPVTASFIPTVSLRVGQESVEPWLHINRMLSDWVNDSTSSTANARKTHTGRQAAKPHTTGLRALGCPARADQQPPNPLFKYPVHSRPTSLVVTCHRWHRGKPCKLPFTDKHDKPTPTQVCCLQPAVMPTPHGAAQQTHNQVVCDLGGLAARPLHHQN